MCVLTEPWLSELSELSDQLSELSGTVGNCRELSETVGNCRATVGLLSGDYMYMCVRCWVLSDNCRATVGLLSGYCRNCRATVGTVGLLLGCCRATVGLMSGLDMREIHYAQQQHELHKCQACR